MRKVESLEGGIKKQGAVCRILSEKYKKDVNLMVKANSEKCSLYFLNAFFSFQFHLLFSAFRIPISDFKTIAYLNTPKFE